MDTPATPETKSIEQLWAEIQRGEEAVKQAEELLTKLRSELNRALGKVGGRLRGMEPTPTAPGNRVQPARAPIQWREKTPLFALCLVGFMASVSLLLNLFPSVDYGLAKSVPTWALLAGTLGVVLALTVIILVGFLSVFSAYMVSKMAFGGVMQVPALQPSPMMPTFETGSYDTKPSEEPVPVQAFKESITRPGQFSQDPELERYMQKMRDGELGPDDFSMLGPKAF